MTLLSEPRAPLQGVLLETCRRPALPCPPPKRQAAPVLSTRSRAVNAPRDWGQRAAVVDDLPGLPLPFNACGVGSPLHAGFASPPWSDLSVSHALAGLRLPKPLQDFYIPVTLLGFDLQGLSLPQGRAPLDDPSSLAVAKLAGPLRAPQTSSASEVCSLRESVPSNER